MSKIHIRPRRSEAGQVLVIVALGMIAFLAMVGLVVDGGNAWGQQRETQNGADSASKAGTAVIQQMLTGATVDGNDVACATEAAANDNGVELVSAEYTEFDGTPLGTDVGACGSATAIPADAQGVLAHTSQDFDTYLMQVVGFTQLTAEADATSVVGRVEGVCPAEDGCPVLPVTFPRTTDTCDGTSRRVIGEDEWVLLNEENGDVLSASNLAIMPLCKKAPGAVGWLDFGCGNLANHITNPCNDEIPIPAWLDTNPGNPNNVEDELDAFTGSQPGVPEPEDLEVRIPIHDFTCSDDDLDDSDPITDCSSYPDWSGNGSHVHYHIPYWAGFKLDGAYVGGSDPECNQAPGSPFAGGNGGTGCLKGWFVAIYTAPGPIVIGPIAPGSATVTGIVLVN
ncbi:MAG: Tad domain-containing protein [Candidatus Limnocylindria bacterium]